MSVDMDREIKKYEFVKWYYRQEWRSFLHEIIQAINNQHVVLWMCNFGFQMHYFSFSYIIPNLRVAIGNM